MNKPRIVGNKMTVPSSQEFLSDVDTFLEATLRGYGAEESVIADIAISVSELVNNAMMHGNQAEESLPVTITISREDQSVAITISDQGSGFDPSGVDDPLAEENLLKEVGRGIFIVRSLMDDVNVEATKNGTTVTVKKAI